MSSNIISHLPHLLVVLSLAVRADTLRPYIIFLLLGDTHLVASERVSPADYTVLGL